MVEITHTSGPIFRHVSGIGGFCEKLGFGSNQRIKNTTIEYIPKMQSRVS
jgi:hypothetical protein